jgi:hypothetical protein
MSRHKFQFGEISAVIGAILFQIGSLAVVLAITVVPYAHTTNEPTAGAMLQVAVDKLDNGLVQLPN